MTIVVVVVVVVIVVVIAVVVVMGEVSGDVGSSDGDGSIIDSKLSFFPFPLAWLAFFITDPAHPQATWVAVFLLLLNVLV